MKKLILLLLIFVSGKISAQTFPVTTILYNGSSSNHIDLVFLADGFTSAEQTNFITQVNTISTALFNTSPYKEYKNLFNVYAIQVSSATSGIMHQVTALIVHQQVLLFHHPVLYLISEANSITAVFTGW